MNVTCASSCSCTCVCSVMYAEAHRGISTLVLLIIHVNILQCILIRTVIHVAIWVAYDLVALYGIESSFILYDTYVCDVQPCNFVIHTLRFIDHTQPNRIVYNRLRVDSPVDHLQQLQSLFSHWPCREEQLPQVL